MNTPDALSNSQVNRLVEQAELPEPHDESMVLHVHPSESMTDVFQALHHGGFRVYCDAGRGGRLVVARPWRIDAEKRAREREVRRAAMTQAELAADNARDEREQELIDKMSRS